jgi:hypothetical protein
LTVAYLQALATEAGVALPGAVDASVTAYRGVPAVDVYRRPAVTLYTALANGVSFTDAKAQGLTRLVSLASTDIQQARNRQAAASIASSGFKSFSRVLSGTEDCELCTVAADRTYYRGDLMPIHPGCVPGDSVLSPIAGGSTHLADFAWGEVEAVSRRLFEGELIEFVTARGDEVRVTPNHPVLTAKGWIPAHLLSEGDTVFSSGSRERVVTGGPYVNERPAFAEDVFDAARMAFPLVRVPLAAEDFHADAAEGEVEIVYTHGNFPTPRNADPVQGASELGFVHAHGGRVALDGSGALGPLIPRSLAALGSGMGGGYLSGDLLRGHPTSSVEASGTAPARFDAPAGEFSPESAPVYASQGLDLVRRLASDVEGDRVVKLRRVGWSGHVFNLHTREGWYSSNNHIVSNCDCGVAPNGFGHASEPLEGARETVVHEHGEYGPTLGWAGDTFTTRDDF